MRRFVPGLWPTKEKVIRSSAAPGTANGDHQQLQKVCAGMLRPTVMARYDWISILSIATLALTTGIVCVMLFFS